MVIIDAKNGTRAYGAITTLWREGCCAGHVHWAHELQELAVSMASHNCVNLATGILYVTGLAPMWGVLQECWRALTIGVLSVDGQVAVHGWDVHVRKVPKPHPGIRGCWDDGLQACLGSDSSRRRVHDQGTRRGRVSERKAEHFGPGFCCPIWFFFGTLPRQADRQ